MSRELFIALGALLVIIILIDGVRRVRNSRYDRIRMSRRKQPIFEDDHDDFSSELPNGGARVISVRDEGDAEQLQEEIRKAAEESKPKLSFASEDSDSSSEEESELDAAPLAHRESADMGEPEANEDSSEPETQKAEVVEEKQPESPAKKKGKRRAGKQPEQASLQLDQPKRDSKKPQEVIVFHLRAGKGNTYNGQSLLEALVEEGMRYGAMDIFHHHAESDGSGDVLFSMANSVEPGTFDLTTMEQMETPGVSFFIDLGVVDDPSDAFGRMLNTIAGCIEKLGGELKDETRSDVTKQTVEHYWQRVRDFERRALSEGA